MARRSFVQINGRLYERGVDIFPDDYKGGHGAHAVMGDLPDFVSIIDGSVVSGRAGMREHCKKHDVVPTADLKGLPVKQFNQNAPPSEAYREATRQTIADIINSRYHNYKG
jgi:hypothetical protein